MKIKVISFGYKYGQIPKASVVFDMRFLRNPYWQKGMRLLTGLDKKVYDYIMCSPNSNIFYNKLKATIDFFLPLAIKKENSGGDVDPFVIVAFGCTGGQHRSVAFAERLGKDLKGEGYDVEIKHRDLKKSLYREIERIRS